MAINVRQKKKNQKSFFNYGVFEKETEFKFKKVHYKTARNGDQTFSVIEIPYYGNALMVIILSTTKD